MIALKVSIGCLGEERCKLQPVELKAWRNGLLRDLLLVIPAESAWQEALTQVEARLQENRNSLLGRGAQLTINFGVRSVFQAELEALVDWLKRDYELLTVAVVGTDSATQEAARKLGLAAYLMLPGTSLAAEESGTLSRNNALYVPQTVRSGQRIVHAGHIIVGGDVNAGAEVVAEGDILVFGVLRGLAHAGSQGNEQARIIAGRMRPQQIRIAGQIARAPEEAGYAGPGERLPEVARIENGAIQVSRV